MKQKTFDILLDCYIKERIPDAEDILGDDLLLQNEKSPTISFHEVPRAAAFCFGPTPRMTTDGPRRFNQNDLLGFHAQSGECTVARAMDISVDVIDSPDIDQTQKCREIARNLARIADSFQRGYTASDDANSRLAPDEYGNGFTPEERHVLERILSQGSSQSISRIATVLADCFTSETLKATILYLTEQNDNISQQLAIALELSTGLINIMGGKILGTIRNVVGGMFQNRAELEDL